MLVPCHECGEFHEMSFDSITQDGTSLCKKCREIYDQASVYVRENPYPLFIETQVV